MFVEDESASEPMTTDRCGARLLDDEARLDRGALPPAHRRWGALGAALIIGLVWAAIHLVPDLQGGHPLGWILWHRLSSIAQRVLIVWVALGTGSVVAAAAMHAADNVSWQLFPINGSAYEPGFVAPLVVLVAVAVITTHGFDLPRRHANAGALPAGLTTRSHSRSGD